ncbi:MAG: redoxin domain-containing protein [Pseudomonadota bacterium]
MALLDFFDRTRTEDLSTGAPVHEVRIPAGYQRQVSWMPQIGDIFPNFAAPSTQGQIDFHDWAEGHWVLMLSHPSTRSGVSATEWGGIASMKAEFDALGIKVLGVCCEHVVDLARWEEQIAASFGLEIDFPTVEDRTGKLSAAFGMIHPKQGKDMAIRKSFVIDPNLLVKMSAEYPINVGRSIDEMLRAIEALQVTDAHRVGIPADWDAGQDCLLAPYITEAEAQAGYGAVRHVEPNMRVIACPDGPAGAHVLPAPPQSLGETYGGPRRP